jgi:hypothetical protein
MKKSKRLWPIQLIALVITFMIAIRTIALLDTYTNISEFFEEAIWSLIGLGFLGVATIILARSKERLIGWILMAPAFGIAIVGLGERTLGPVADFTEPLSVAEWFFVWFSGTSWNLLIIPIFLIALVFPNGQLTRRIEKIGFRVLIITFGLFQFFATFSYGLGDTEITGRILDNPVGFIPKELSDLFFPIFSVLLLSTTVLCLISVVGRFRLSTGVERAQLKWLFLSLTLFLSVYILTFVFTGGDFGLVVGLLFAISVLLIPIAIGIAIMRYRIWDIDFVVNRSLVYGLLTAVIAAIWAGSLSLIDQVIVGLVGDTSKAASTVLSTLFAASIFQPARKRIEDWSNKRFFPEKLKIERAFLELEPRHWGNLDLKTIGQLSIERVCRILKANSGALFVSNNRGSFTVLSTTGKMKDEIRELTLDAKALNLLQKEKAVSLDDSFGFHRFAPIWIPREGPNEILGLIGLDLRENNRGYSAYELEAVVGLGRKIGEAIFNLELRGKTVNP